MAKNFATLGETVVGALASEGMPRHVKLDNTTSGAIMREMILRTLKKVLEEHPEIKADLTGEAAQIVEDGIDWHMKFEPYIGDDNPVYDADDWEITQEDIDRAIDVWDKLMPEYAGMLDATIEVEDNA